MSRRSAMQGAESSSSRRPQEKLTGAGAKLVAAATTSREIIVLEGDLSAIPATESLECISVLPFTGPAP
ncbi:MAG: hypothetical protein ACE5I7_19360 [Candidatus Binatia bacterium]